MSRSLAFERAPAFAVPLQFLLAAPLLALPAAALLLYYGPEILATRWSPATLALTHLVALGFIAHSILGALLQYLPVAIGADLRRLHRAAPAIELALAAGTLLLVVGLLLASTPLLRGAGWLLALALGAFTLMTIAELVRGWSNDATTHALAISVAAFIATIAIGFIFAAYPEHAASHLVPLVDLHAAWGLAGWVAITVFGVALVVVPMFQLTPQYPVAVQRGLPLILLTGLTALSVAVCEYLPALAAAALALLAAALATFGIATLRLQHASRRRADVTVWLWRMAMVSVTGAALLGASAFVAPAIAQQPWFALALGILMLAGFAMSVINGMMYKIVPFLIWLHLQQVNSRRQSLPHMHKIIPEKSMRRQAWAHAIAVALLLAALAWPPAVYGAGIAWAAAQLMLAFNLAGAARRYAVTRAALAAA